MYPATRGGADVRRASAGEIGAIRGKLYAFAAATVVAALVGLPGWTRLALAATTIAIPLAVAVHAGLPGLRLLLRPPFRSIPRASPASGVRRPVPGRRRRSVARR
ncbi:hypothetical protein AB0J86_07170 [Micromonospora sp. NPDC049559]|uniref:hypothetical protein n=1 Tax=Micromonospora sp. NPDC049559 TaxID=3155923 RepID=UPI0034271833